MTKTRDKLNEAIFFLDKMEEIANNSYYAANPRGHKEFKHYLNAFLSAARSVTSLPKPLTFDKKGKIVGFILENEFYYEVGFDKWYKSKVTQTQGNQVFEVLTKHRNLTIHKEAFQPHGVTHATIVERNYVRESAVAFSYPAHATEEEIEKLRLAATPIELDRPILSSDIGESKTEQTWYFKELAEKGLPSTVIPVCKEHIKILEQLVNECEQRFTSPCDK